jgi:hypothetical protein
MDFNKFKNQMIRYGIMLGIVSGVLSLGIYAIDYTMMIKWWYGIVALFVSIFVIIFAINDFKKENDGLASFKELFFMILGMVFISSTISTLFSIILFQVVDPELGGKLDQAIINQTVEMMENFNTPDDIIDKTVADMEGKSNFSLMAILRSWLMGSLIGGGILGLIFGTIFKKKAPEML